MSQSSSEQLAFLLQHIKQTLHPLREQTRAALDLSTYRTAFAALANLQKPIQNVIIKSLNIGNMLAEWLIPSSPASGQVILYFHSGMYISGSLETDRVLASALACTTRMKVLQVSYCLAPENPFPTPAYDGIAAYQWLLAQKYLPEQIAFAGIGAGGGITIAVLLLARDQGYPLPVVAACLSPWLDLTSTGIQAKQQSMADAIFTTDLLEYAARQYVSPQEAGHPLASPLYADVHGLPPLFLQVAQHELLHEDAQQFAHRVRALHGRARCVSWANAFHGWQAFADVLPTGQLALDQVAAYFEKYFSLVQGTWPDTTETWKYTPYPNANP